MQSGVRGLSPRLAGATNYGCCWSEVIAVARTLRGLSLTTSREVSASPRYCNRTHRCNRNIQHGPPIRHNRSIRPLSGGRFGAVGRSGTVPADGRVLELRLELTGCCWSEVIAVSRTLRGQSLTRSGEVSASPGYCNRAHRCNRNIQHGPAIRHDRSIRPLSGKRFGAVGRSGTVPAAGRVLELRVLLVRSDCRRADSAGTVPDYGWRSVRESRVLQSNASVQPQHSAWPCNSARPLHSAAFRRAVW